MSNGNITLDLSFEDYVSLPGVNSSSLKVFERSPQHYQKYISGEIRGEDTADFALGRALHALALEPDKFNERYAKGPDVRRDSKEWKEFCRLHAGKDVFKPKEFDEIFLMGQAIRTHDEARQLLDNIITEVTLQWQHPATGLTLKARLDAYSKKHKAIIDVKTTTDASSRGFSRAIAEYRYHRQAAYYWEGAKECGLRVEKFYFIAIEKKPHYPVAVYELDKYVIKLSMHENTHLLTQLAACKEVDHWPGYTKGFETISLPDYALKNLTDTYDKPF